MLALAIFDHQPQIWVPSIDGEHPALSSQTLVATQKVELVLPEGALTQKRIAKVDNVCLVAVLAR